MKLKNIHIEDIEDVIVKIEKSFQIQFENNELKEVKTFGDLCYAFKMKIDLKNSDDCTSQQAFYKLRKAISETTIINKDQINQDINLETLFPKKRRRRNIKKLEKNLGFQLSILSPKQSTINGISCLFFVFFITLFFSWKIGVLGIIIALFSFVFAYKTANTLNVKTIKDLIYKTKKENYLNARRNKKTFNKKEIDTIIIDLFSDYLDLDKKLLTKDAELY
ncbi:hypothetical protein [Polaribacter porphyrae]|uniref:Uncharacterized protein n=1 Tax=Polaribacter porphyrae TaxID=1137780 RepID=A0A2S7WRT9_9FLAO|nr:hypothetical protein [Polaribacter porphyrae]PQJ80031.1 hypothetical protein BTO18_12990 [Polaribacter porphyrae]